MSNELPQAFFEKENRAIQKESADAVKAKFDAERRAEIEGEISQLNAAANALKGVKEQVDQTDTAIYHLRNAHKSDFKGDRRNKFNNKLDKLHAANRKIMADIDDDIQMILAKSLQLRAEIG